MRCGEETYDEDPCPEMGRVGTGKDVYARGSAQLGCASGIVGGVDHIMKSIKKPPIRAAETRIGGVLNDDFMNNDLLNDGLLIKITR